VLLALGNPLLRRSGVLNPTRTAAIGNVVVVGDPVSLNNRPVVVGGMNRAFIHAHDRGVVGKFMAAPFASRKTNAAVSVAVVHAAVVAHVPAPVAPVEPVVASEPAPVGRRPQGTLIRSRNPRAWNPVVVPVAVRPVAWNPHQVGPGTVGLLINRQFGWSKTHTYDDLCLRRSGKDRENQRQQKPTRRAEQSHEKNLHVLSCLPR
jgi:hypothetical protein